MAEVYAGVLIVSVTIALSAFVYSQARFHVTSQPVFSLSSFDIVGSPSILHLQVNSSGRTQVSELRVDGVSSEAGVLRLASRGYSAAGSLCAPGATTFFSVNSTAGNLDVGTNGSVWIDGVESQNLAVGPGWHEVMIKDASACTVTLPDGSQPTFPSPSLSSLPRVASGLQSFVFMVPFATSGHSLTLVFDGGIEEYAF